MQSKFDCLKHMLLYYRLRDAARIPQMCAGASEQALPYVCLAQEELDVLFGPVPRW